MHLLGSQTTTKVFGAAHTTNEDCFAPHAKKEVGINRFVMCDGATMGFAGGAWAQALVAAIADCDASIDWPNVVSLARDAYNAWFRPETMNIFKQQNFMKGSSATVLLADQDTAQANLIHLTAIGDSCCFAIRTDGAVLKSFPISDATDFAKDPYLVTCTDEGIRCLFDEQYRNLFWKTETWDFSELKGCRLVCATDAVSRWIVQNRDKPLKIAGFVDFAIRKKRRAEYTRRIQWFREHEGMVTDDSTIAVLSI